MEAETPRRRKATPRRQKWVRHWRPGGCGNCNKVGETPGAHDGEKIFTPVVHTCVFVVIFYVFQPFNPLRESVGWSCSRCFCFSVNSDSVIHKGVSLSTVGVRHFLIKHSVVTPEPQHVFEQSYHSFPKKRTENPEGTSPGNTVSTCL